MKVSKKYSSTYYYTCLLNKNKRSSLNAHLLPFLTGLFGNFCDRGARILLFDCVPVSIEPEKVCRHGALWRILVFRLLLPLALIVYILKRCFMKGE